ncbi:hypothetical protein EVAR_73028_1 [Eumeta japonica]|uniref:Uncharacterized protein n=1 Tax=Eumeta variegata TaxID=151549 RepID=A0A4C1SSY3_EUMVA|nr:hypothetical protein EVAR_73028_1 [Eumeta japonica]
MEERLHEQHGLTDAQKSSQVVASSTTTQISKVDNKKLFNEQDESKIKGGLANSKNVCREIPKSIRNISKINRDILSGGYECDDDDKDVVIRQLRNGCDIPSDKVLEENVPGKPKINNETCVNLISTHKSAFTNTYNSSVISSAGHDIEITKSDKDIKAQDLNIKLDETPTVISAKGAIRETDEDEVQRNHYKISQYSKEHRQCGPQQSIVEVEPTTRTLASNGENNSGSEGLTITRSLSLSSQKSGVPLKAQSLDSRPIYPNVPYSPYASPLQ